MAKYIPGLGKLSIVNLDCPFMVRFTEITEEDFGGQSFKTDLSLNVLIGKIGPITNRSEAIGEFKELYKEEYGVLLTDNQATEYGDRLIGLIKAVYGNDYFRNINNLTKLG